MKNKYSIKTIDYNSTRDRTVMRSCLSRWFQNPKDLQLTSPNMRYPFQFQNWLSIYKKTTAVSMVIKEKDWIVGHLSFRFIPDEKRIHLFHVIIDRDHRGKGLASQLIKVAEAQGKEGKCTMASLYVNPKNPAALHLYQKHGYEIIGKSNSGSIRMMKEL